jgi:hypothetical protein
MRNFAPVRSRLVMLGLIVGVALSMLWLAWRLMLVHSLAAIICFWATLVCALVGGLCLFATFGALSTFCCLASTCGACKNRCYGLKLTLSLGVLLLASLVLISVWGAHFTLKSYNLLVALTFATNSAVTLTAVSAYDAIQLSTCQETKG